MTMLQPNIRRCPEPKFGVHVWTLEAAWDCRRSGLNPEEAIELITNRMTRPPQYREVEDSVSKAYETDLVAQYTCKPTIKAVYDPEKLNQVAGKIQAFGEADLWKKSPILPDSCTPATFLYHLFRPGEIVIVFDRYRSQGQVHWVRPQDGEEFNQKRLNRFIYPESGNGSWFLSNPVNGREVCVKRLKRPWNPLGSSFRAEENITRFPHLLLESDSAPTGLWIKALVQLPLPIVSITMSGGDSVHALVRVDAENADEWAAYKAKIAPIVVTLGACVPSLSAVRLTRLPGCFRAEKNGWQTLLYLNPSADGTPIQLLPDSRSHQNVGITDVRFVTNCNQSAALVL